MDTITAIKQYARPGHTACHGTGQVRREGRTYACKCVVRAAARHKLLLERPPVPSETKPQRKARRAAERAARIEDQIAALRFQIDYEHDCARRNEKLRDKIDAESRQEIERQIAISQRETIRAVEIANQILALRDAERGALRAAAAAEANLSAERSSQRTRDSVRAKLDQLRSARIAAIEAEIEKLERQR